jgi:hypothetical protein
MIAWHMLTKNADYIWARPALLARKFRAVELRLDSRPSIHEVDAPMIITSQRDGRRNERDARRLSATMPPCFKMNAFWASVNFEAFIIFRSSQPGKLPRKTPVLNGPVIGEQNR